MNQFDTKSMVLPILYFKGPHVKKCKSLCIPILHDCCNVSRDNADPEEITHAVALVTRHLCMGIQYKMSFKLCLSYDVESGSDVMPFIK